MYFYMHHRKLYSNIISIHAKQSINRTIVVFFNSLDGSQVTSATATEIVVHPRENPLHPLVAGTGNNNGGTDKADDIINASIIEDALRDTCLLHVVAESGDSENHKRCATAILAKDRTLFVAQRPPSNETALDRAAKLGHSNMVSHLIDITLRTSVDGKKRKMFALHLLNINLIQGHTEEAEESSQDENNRMSPLYLAVSLGYSDIADKLTSTFGNALPHHGPKGQNALHAAATRSVGKSRFLLVYRCTNEV